MGCGCMVTILSLPVAHDSLISPYIDTQVLPLLTSDAELHQAGVVGEEGGQAIVVRQPQPQVAINFELFGCCTRFRRLSRLCQIKRAASVDCSWPKPDSDSRVPARDTARDRTPSGGCRTVGQSEQLADNGPLSKRLWQNLRTITVLDDIFLTRGAGVF